MVTYEQSLDQRGLLVVLTGPSGVGKNSIIDALREEDPRFFHSVSMTTRQPRKGEHTGIAYCGEYYGTPSAPIDRMIQDNIDVLLDLTVNGALELKRKCPNAIIIFITASTEEALRDRLLARGTESEEAIESRLATAREELGRINLFDYWVINDVIAATASDIRAIVKAEKRRVSRFFVDECTL